MVPDTFFFPGLNDLYHGLKGRVFEKVASIMFSGHDIYFLAIRWGCSLPKRLARIHPASEPATGARHRHQRRGAQLHGLDGILGEGVESGAEAVRFPIP